MSKSNFSDCFDYAYISETGLLRGNNEDSVAILPEQGCFVVADGMGGGDGGEIASQIIVENVKDALTDAAIVSPGERKFVISKTVYRANSSINEVRIARNFNTMGSTVVLLLFDPWDFSGAAVCHVGDSRAYCFRKGKLLQLTRDHNVETEWQQHIASGKKVDPAFGKLLTRVVGVSENFCPEWTDVSVCQDDIFIICSDGLSSVLSTKQIIKILAVEKSSTQYVQALKSEILAAGAPDNFSIICVKIRNVPPPAVVDDGVRKESDYLLDIAERLD